MAEDLAQPVWFLDVDGTLAPLTDDPAAVDAYLYEVAAPEPTGAVGYRSDILARIQDLHDRGAVEVRWLTTWGPGMVEAWHNRGFGPFIYAAEEADHGVASGVAAKAFVVRAWLDLAPETRVIWTDDHAAPGWVVPGYPPERLLIIAPLPDVGLTHEHLDEIERWIAGGGGE